MGLMPYKRKPAGIPSPFHQVRTQQEGTGYESSLDHVGTLILDFQPPELGEINVCCL